MIRIVSTPKTAPSLSSACDGVALSLTKSLAGKQIMAQWVSANYVRGLSGEELGEDLASVQFGYLGVEYEVDLSRADAEKFAEVRATHVKTGRRVRGRRQTAAWVAVSSVGTYGSCMRVSRRTATGGSDSRVVRTSIPL